MERGWSRHSPLLDVSTASAEAIVRLAFPDARVEAAEPLSGGLRNTNLLLRLAGDAPPLVLRLYTADPDACCREIAAIATLAGLAPVPTVHLADGTSEPPFALLEWLPGLPLDQVLAAASDDQACALARACGATLAAIHAIEMPAAGFLGPALRVVAPLPGWGETIRALLDGRAGAWLGAPLTRELLAAVARHESEIDGLAGRAVLCHADYKPWNLLAAGPGATRLAGVVDWEFAVAAPPLLDVAIFLRDDGRRPAGYAEAFVAGYESAGGTLPPDWRRLARTLDLINLCQILDRGGPEAAADLVPIVEATLGEI